MKEHLKNYIEQLLENVADECNVKHIILEHKFARSTYSYDTMYNKSIGLDEEWPLFSLIFSGNISEDMKKVMDLVSEGLKQRAVAKIKVRQPLNDLTISI